MCNWVTILYSRKMTEHCKPAIMEKDKNHYINLKKKKKKEKNILWLNLQLMEDPEGSGIKIQAAAAATSNNPLCQAREEPTLMQQT